MVVIWQFAKTLTMVLALASSSAAAPQLKIPEGLSVEQRTSDRLYDRITRGTGLLFEIIPRDAENEAYDGPETITVVHHPVHASTEIYTPILTETVTPGVTPTCCATPSLTIDPNKLTEEIYVQTVGFVPTSAPEPEPYLEDVTYQGGEEYALLARPPGMTDCQDGCRKAQHKTHHKTTKTTKTTKPHKPHKPTITATAHHTGKTRSKLGTGSRNHSATAHSSRPSRTVRVWVDPALHTRPLKNATGSHHTSSSRRASSHHASSKHRATSATPCKNTTETLTKTATASFTITASLTIHPSSPRKTHESVLPGLHSKPSSTGSSHSTSVPCHAQDSHSSPPSSSSSHYKCGKPIRKTTSSTYLPSTLSITTRSTITVTLGCRKSSTTRTKASNSPALPSPEPPVVVETEVKTQFVTYCPSDDEATATAHTPVTYIEYNAGARETETRETIIREYLGAKIVSVRSPSKSLAARDEQYPLRPGTPTFLETASAATPTMADPQVAEADQQYLSADQSSQVVESAESYGNAGHVGKGDAIGMLTLLPPALLVICYLL